MGNDALRVRRARALAAVVLLLGVGLLVAATAALLGPWIGAALAGIALVLTGLFLISIPDEETK